MECRSIMFHDSGGFQYSSAVSSLTRSSKSKRDTRGQAAAAADDNFLLNIAFYMYHRAASIGKDGMP